MDHSPPPPPQNPLLNPTALNSQTTIPLPPPLPPHLAKKAKSNHPTTTQLPPTPNQSSSKLPPPTLQTTPPPPFSPCYMFFYGTLMDPDVLKTLLRLPKLPTTQPASLKGFRVKMWGIYPALVACNNDNTTNDDNSNNISKSDSNSNEPLNSTVHGQIWKCESEAHFNALAAYETDAYTWVECEVALDDGSFVSGVRTFCWRGDPASRELEEGRFDFKRWKRYFKGSVVRR